MTRQPLIDPKDSRFLSAFALYEESFPVHERRTRQAQQERLGCPGYHFDVLMEGEAVQGILLWWEAGPFCYVEHFAIVPQLRGTGIGTRALEQLRKEGRRVLLEIDPPVDEVARRRQRFYEKAGFCENPFHHIHPPYRAGFSGHELVVMTSPGPITQEEYQEFARYLDEVVMSDCKPPLEENR